MPNLFSSLKPTTSNTPFNKSLRRPSLTLKTTHYQHQVPLPPLKHLKPVLTRSKNHHPNKLQTHPEPSSSPYYHAGRYTCHNRLLVVFLKNKKRVPPRGTSLKHQVTSLDHHHLGVRSGLVFSEKGNEDGGGNEGLGGSLRKLGKAMMVFGD